MIKIISIILILFLLFTFLNIFDFKSFEPCKTWDCFNSFALWISAIGMVAISSLSLWLSIKDKLVLIDGIFRLSFIPSTLHNKNILDRQVFTLSFVNIGRRKIKIDNFKLCFNHVLVKIWSTTSNNWGGNIDGNK